MAINIDGFILGGDNISGISLRDSVPAFGRLWPVPLFRCMLLLRAALLLWFYGWVAWRSNSSSSLCFAGVANALINAPKVMELGKKLRRNIMPVLVSKLYAT